MPKFIVKQPDGKYAVFSTFADRFVLLNATAEELTQFWVDQEVERIKQWVNQTLDKIERGIPDRQHDWAKCLHTIQLIHGPDGLKELEQDLKGE